MSFYQNVFGTEYNGYYIISDLKGYTLTFKVPANKNIGEYFICWNTGPFDLTGKTSLTFNISQDLNFKNWSSFTVNLGAITVVTASQIIDILNADATFANYFTASLYKTNQVGIRQKKPVTQFKSFISNTSAETVLRFNRFAGIADIPSYFDKDTIENTLDTPESNGLLIRLGKSITANTAANPSVVTCAGHGLNNGDTVYFVNSNSTPVLDGARVVTVINSNQFSVPVNVTTAGTMGEFLTQLEVDLLEDAGIDYSTMLTDYEHLKGRCGGFTFTKNTVDGSNRVTQSIIYTTGSVAGSLAKKIIYTYSGANTTPSSVMEIPHVLTAADLLTP